MIVLFRKLVPLVLILIVWDYSLRAYGPVSPTDSLEQVFGVSRVDSVKYNAAKEIMKISFERDANLGLRYAILSFDLARKLGKSDRYAFHHNTKGLFLTSLGRYQEAINEFQKGLETISLIPKEKSRANFQASLHGNLGLAYGYLGATEKEQAEYLKALEIAEEYDFIQTKAIFTNNLCKLYLDVGNLEQAEKYIQKSLKIIEGIDYPAAKVLPYLNLGSLFIAKNQTDSATKYFEEGLQHAEASGSLYDKGASLIELSEILITQGQYEKAHDFALRAVAVSKELGNKELSILADLAMSRTKRKMGNLKEAEICVERAYSLLTEKAPLTELKIFEEMEKIALANADFKQAQEVGMKIRVLRDTLLDINRQNYIATAESRLALEKMEVEGLEKDKKLREQAIQQRTLVLGFTWLALLLALIAGVFLVRNIRQGRNYTIKLEREVELRTEKLREVNKELESANFELKRFNRVISHDLKAPIDNINGLLEITKGELGATETISQNLTYIEKSTTQLERILADVSLFYNFDKGELVREEIDMKELMEGVALALQCSLAERKVAFSFPDMPVVTSYWTPVFLTFKNLVENAVKYNESEIPEISVSYQKAREKHIFEVADNGIGISPQHYEKVFELFERVSPLGKYSGTGLGLSISKKMIQDIGGEVRIKTSDLNKGTIFEVHLPIKAAVLSRKQV